MDHQIKREEAEKLWKAILDYGKDYDTLPQLEKAFADVTFWRPVAPNRNNKPWFTNWVSGWGFTRIFRPRELGDRKEIKL
jgi:hypothetical protein